VHEGDSITIDAHKLADPAQRRQRRAREATRRVEGAGPRYTKGLLAKYMKLVSTASLGRDHRRR
jgi:dihydroxy-acid dehydratase